MPGTKTIPDRDALKRVGAMVRKRLDTNAAAQRLDTDKLEIFGIAEFLTAPECQRLMTMIDLVAKPSELFSVEYSSGFRTSYSGNLNPHDPFVRGISDRIDALLGLKAPLGESIQGQRYLPGQEFKPHNDWFYTDEPYWQTERKNGGQRSWTAMAYLNAVGKGGATHFTNIGLSVDPQPGALLVWNNASVDGIPNEDAIHAGTPVLDGEKYIITKWYRTRKWG